MTPDCMPAIGWNLAYSMFPPVSEVKIDNRLYSATLRDPEIR